MSKTPAVDCNDARELIQTTASAWIGWIANHKAPILSKTTKDRLPYEQGRLKKSYPLGQAKAHLSEIVSHVETTGEEIVVTRHGKPVARLVPERGTGPRPLGFARGRVKLYPGWSEPLSYEDLLGE